MKRALTITRWTRRRRGSVYAIVLGAATSVMVIGLAALMAFRIEHRSAQGGNDFAQAMFYAQSAVEMGFLRIRDNSDWRTGHASGAWFTDEPIGTGMFILDVNHSGALQIPEEPGDGETIDVGGRILPFKAENVITLTGTGVQGEARAKAQVQILEAKGGYVIIPGTWKQVVD